MRKRRIIVSLYLLTAMGCSSPKTPDPKEIIDQIVIVKSQHTMILLSHGLAVRKYRIAIGRGPGNAKQHSGDHETPEGTYLIDGKNIHSSFHKALHISYPNIEDKKRARDAGVDPGGQIMIHGIRNGLGWIGTFQSMIDWTDGCIAITDREIDEIWNIVPVGTKVEIRP